jgi:hypothetical protein
MAEANEQEDFSWIQDSILQDRELSPYLEDVPSNIRVLYIYTNEHYSIGKVRKEMLDVSNGVFSREMLAETIAANRTHDGLKYRFACAFYYITNCSASQVIAYGEDKTHVLEAQLQDISVLEDLSVPSCAKMLQKLNAVYVVFQRLKSSSCKKVTRKVRFEVPSGRKTRRL